MAYLAGVLGRVADEGYDAVSDSKSSLKLFCNGSSAADRTGQIRLIVLNKILPAPAETVAPVLLAEFKDQYSRQLASFNREIEERVLQLALVRPEDLQFALDKTTEGLQDEVDELAARVKERCWGPISFGNFCSAVTAVVEAADKHWIGATAAVALGVGPMVVDVLRRNGREVDDKPLAYAAHAQKRFERISR